MLGRTALKRTLFVLLREGPLTVCIAASVVRSYRTVSPLPDPLRAIGGLFSVESSVTLRCPAVNWFPVLWSPDFPLWVTPQRSSFSTLCHWWESNPHALSSTRLSTWQVYLFHHSDVICYLLDDPTQALIFTLSHVRGSVPLSPSFRMLMARCHPSQRP
jgi:hypothetical protein